ncbi:MAG: hypothetical protein M3093_01110 [Thermoproteota archaeon]|nr:hypothetical protein [Thermoproteota archaeon]
MNVAIVFPSIFADAQTLVKVIKKRYRAITHIITEGNCIVVKGKDAPDLASELGKMFGVENVAIAVEVSTNFSELLTSIVEAGSRIIAPGDRFYVKVLVHTLAPLSYKSRDVEFACTGLLASKLASIDALPAKSEAEASRLILVVVGKNAGYISINFVKGPGGLVTGHQGLVVGSIHSSLSLISCMMAAKVGFDCADIVLPYASDIDLEANARLAALFALRTGRKRQTIFAVPINFPTIGDHLTLLKEKIISQILFQCQGKVINLPLSTAVHPLWFVESIIHDAVYAGKIPLTPMIALSSELGNYAKDIRIDLSITPQKIRSDELENYSSSINSEARSALKYMKKLDLKVGPNYVHDIIDSI